MKKQREYLEHELFKYVQLHFPINSRSDYTENKATKAKSIDKDTKTISYILQYAKYKGRRNIKLFFLSTITY